MSNHSYSGSSSQNNLLFEASSPKSSSDGIKLFDFEFQYTAAPPTNMCFKYKLFAFGALISQYSKSRGLSNAMSF